MCNLFIKLEKIEGNMFRNYLKFTFRNILKQKAYSVINILGLSVGIACFVLLMLWVNDELGYDAFHENADKIFRVLIVDKTTQPNLKYAVVSAPVSPTMKDEFPEVKSFVRIIKPPRKALVEYKDDDKRFYEQNIAWSESGFFDVFSFDLVRGNPKTALTNPNQIVITEAIAKKYFGEEDPIGKSISISMRFIELTEEKDYVVTGVLKNIPSNSHLQFNFIGSLSSLESVLPGQIENWNMHAYNTYILLNDQTNQTSVENKIPGFIKKHFDSATANDLGIDIQPLKNIHLQNDVLFEPTPTGNRVYIYILSVVGFSILLIAVVNYMNLATARSTNRAKEVGVKKVLGAEQKNLAFQFVGEAILMSFAALLVAVLLAEIILPSFNDISGKQISINYFDNIFVIPGLIGIAVITGLLGGSYPAIYLSSLMPGKILKGKLSAASRNILLRKSLIVAQFSVTVIMFIGTFIVYDQLNYFRDKNLGFNKEQVLVVSINSGESDFDRETLRNEFQSIPNVESASLAAHLPGEILPRYSIRGEGKSDEELLSLVTVSIDDKFIETLEIEVLAGRSFSKDFEGDESNFIINESALKVLEIPSPEEAIGKSLEAVELGTKGKIIGIVKDFNFASLHTNIEPLIFHYRPSLYGYYTLKLNANNLFNTVNVIESKWNEFEKDKPIQYYFLDDKFEQLYQSETRLGEIFIYFSVIAIFIGALGLFGLASFMAEQRRREIGIRKVLGASNAGVVSMLSKEFLKLLIVSNIIAWPAANIVMNNWLDNFAYRIDIEYTSFILAGLFTVIIALLTVSYQSIKAAKQNPVDSLRVE